MESMVFSCRAMIKTVEESYLNYIMREGQKEKAELIEARNKQTKRSEAMKKIIENTGFEMKTEKEDDL